MKVTEYFKYYLPKCEQEFELFEIILLLATLMSPLERWQIEVMKDQCCQITNNKNNLVWFPLAVFFSIFFFFIAIVSEIINSWKSNRGTYYCTGEIWKEIFSIFILYWDMPFLCVHFDMWWYIISKMLLPLHNYHLTINEIV